MDDFRSSGRDLQRSLWSWGLGFLGVLAVFKLLPRTIKYVIRRFVFGLISEIVFVVIAALLTEKIAGHLTGRNDDRSFDRPSP